MDPYKVLGVLPHSSKDDIKNAYENLIDTYSLDQLEDDSVKSFYEEKLSEANEAFRIINHNMTCDEVRDLIDKDDFIQAESKLNLVTDASSAEWNYLKGVLLIKKGWVDSGVSHIKRAATLNPYNSEYIATMKTLNQKVGAYKNSYSSQGNSSGGLNICGNSGNSGNSGSGKNGLC